MKEKLTKFIKRNSFLISVAILALVVGLGVKYVESADPWNEPPGAPTSCPAGSIGCDAPINVGSNYQEKWGRLMVGDFITSGGAIFNAGGIVGFNPVTTAITANGNIWVKDTFRIGIGTNNPSSSYGLHIVGSGGIGMDNNGSGNIPVAFKENGTDMARVTWNTSNNTLRLTTRNIANNNNHEGIIINEESKVGIGPKANADSLTQRLEVDGNIKLLYASGKGLLIGNETFSDANPIAGPWLFCDDNSGTAFQGSCGFRIGPSADVNDFFSFGYAPGQYAKIYARSITTTNPAETRSDVRLKKDIATINDVLRGLMSIRGASYTRTDAKGSEIDRRELGVIAQEVETAFPDLVHIDPVSGYKTVNYDGFVGVFIEAIKEQQAEIDDLQKQIDELKAQVEGLK